MLDRTLTAGPSRQPEYYRPKFRLKCRRNGVRQPVCAGSIRAHAGPCCFDLVSCPRNKHAFRCDQNGPPARREEGAYPERYVTDEQRGRRPIFIATLRAAASWLFFRVVRSSRIDLDTIVARALKNSQPTCGERHAYFGDRTLAWLSLFPSLLREQPGKQFGLCECTIPGIVTNAVVFRVTGMAPCFFDHFNH